ncbi:hypothetical protein FHL15_002823 [Xylaria flabelliformis]|uniref:Transcription factor domain-containing protein n=1 Tax=Xylaria flabelliformis TaxID=2512241 RepID=A0A553I7C1_9PEZI|nr:hypothetical protein FHL15_002823 [Xylaria flabelliformis]
MTGIACPGYNEVEPSRLKWLAPGRVVSRTRRPKQPSSDTATHGDMSPESVNGLTPGAGCVAVPLFESQKEGFALFQAVEYSRHNPQSKGLIESFFRYRGLAIRSLSEEINIEDRRTSDVIIAGIITLLLLDVQHGASPSWRCHLEGVQRLITLRGGALALAPLKHLESLLLCFVFVAVIGNTTSSASNLAMTGFHIEQLEDIIEQYGTGVFLFQMCPPTLFAEIIRINRVRMQGAEYESAKVEGLSQEADKILSRICAFSAQQWAASKPSSKQDWELLGNVYQAAVTLYCILSLQSLSILPLETSLRVQCATQGKLLWGLLNQALSSPRTRNFMLWPLVLLGVETINYNEAIDETMRSFVEEQLSDLSSYTGSYAPLVARDVLGRFWASGETRWDACFDRPYSYPNALTTKKMAR